MRKNPFGACAAISIINQLFLRSAFCAPAACFCAPICDFNNYFVRKNPFCACAAISKIN
jgi:hypothetical protein